MSGHLRVADPGFSTTVQDLGRPGHQHLGIPVGGALDEVALRAANVLVGNPAPTAALEILHVGPTLVVEAEAARFAIAGVALRAERLADATAAKGTAVPLMTTFTLTRGEALRLRSLDGAAVACLAVEGGIAVDPLLGSAATCLRGGFGGWNGRPLAAGDLLPLRRDHPSGGDERRFADFALAAPTVLRVVLGPQDDRFDADEIAAFLAGPHRVTPDWNRLGMRLAGRPIRHADGFDITSDAIAPGSIQVTGSGQAIVLLADRQTTGGYPKIATVISADLPALGRLRIGAEIAFRAVSLAEAVGARRALFDEIAGLSARTVPIAADLARRLASENLVGGVVDAVAPRP